MSYTLCASLLYRNSHRESSEKIPDKPPLAATSVLNSSALSRRYSDVDCLSTPCPKCNKRSIVQRSPNTFDCLNCNFHKRLPPISASHKLIAPRNPRTGRLDASGLSSYGLGNTEVEGSGLDTGRIGQGSLSRFLENNRSPLYIPPDHTTAETDAAQPVIFAVIAVIIGILIL